MNTTPKVLAADSSRIQIELSQKIFSKSTFESIHKGNYLENVVEKPSVMINRRLKEHRHPLSGMKALIPEMTSQSASNPEFYANDLKSAHRLNSKILETWINNTISDAGSLNFPNQVLKPDSKLPLMRFGIDRTTLLKAGLVTGDVDRLYRSLFVYSIGFYQLIQKVLQHTENKYTIVTGIWKVYAILLEYCCQLDYQMIITTLNLEKKEELESMEAEFQTQIDKLESHERQMIENINFSKIRLQEVQKELQNEVNKREELEDELLRRGSGHEEEVAMRLQFESKLNQMYAKMRDMQTKIELMLVNLTEIQIEAKKKTEKLHKEKDKNVQLTKIRTEIELEMRKIDEKYKQTESMNNLLEKRINDCYSQIENLNIDLSNLNSDHNETLNTLAQKKIEIDDLKFALEVHKAKIEKTEATILENEAEKKILVQRITDLEAALSQESSTNNFYKQEYVKIVESDKINSTELSKIKIRYESQEKLLSATTKERDTLIIRLESITTVAEEYKISSKDLQIKLEEMNKGRRIVEEQNDSLKLKLEERLKEIKEFKTNIINLREQQERHKNKEAELEVEITELKIKIQSIQKQLETTRETLQEKIDNLHEILESEKKIRENWIHRYEEEQKMHSNVTRELLVTHDKLNEANIKNNNLQASLDEIMYQKTKYSDAHKENLDEILTLRAENEDYYRKNKTLQLLIESIDADYQKREEETKKEFENIKDGLEQQISTLKLRVEDVWTHGSINYLQKEETELYNIRLNRTLKKNDKTIADLNTELMSKSQDIEGKSMILEDSREFIIKQFNMIVLLQESINTLKKDLNQSRKELIDFKNLAPPELKTLPNPFKALLNQINDLKNKLKLIEKNKPSLKDAQMQWNQPLPETYDKDIQTDPIITEKIIEPKSRTSTVSKQSSKSSKSSATPILNEVPLRKKINSAKKEEEEEEKEKYDETYDEIYEKYEEIEDEEYIQTGLHHDEERITPLNLKSIYNKEFIAEQLELPQKSPGKLPIINNKRGQPSPTVHTPTPIPTLPTTDFKRYLKQVISRRRKD
jgi:hypothetical protein